MLASKIQKKDCLFQEYNFPAVVYFYFTEALQGRLPQQQGGLQVVDDQGFHIVKGAVADAYLPQEHHMSFGDVPVCVLVAAFTQEVLFAQRALALQNQCLGSRDAQVAGAGVEYKTQPQAIDRYPYVLHSVLFFNRQYYRGGAVGAYVYLFAIVFAFLYWACGRRVTLRLGCCLRLLLDAFGLAFARTPSIVAACQAK